MNDMARYIDCYNIEKDLQERYEYYRKESEIDVGSNSVLVDETMQTAAMIAKYCLDQIKKAPTADVVPKSEYDAVVSAVDNSTKEFLKLHDTYQEQNAEIERLNQILNSYALQYGTVTVKHAVIDKAKAKVAREIFEEIDNILDPIIQLNYAISVQHEDPIERAKAISAEQALRAFRDCVAELKKKYQGGELNGD